MSHPRQGFDLASDSAGVAQLVESQFSKLIVEGSSPFSRSTASSFTARRNLIIGHEASKPAHLAQMVEHVLGKDEVTSSILVVGSNNVQLQ